MPDYSKLELAKYRLEKARECYADAVSTFESGSLSNAANRIYYSIFHAMRAVLALDEFDSKKHSGIISEFRKTYIKTGVFDVKFSETIEFGLKLRGKSDYDDFYVIPKADVAKQIDDSIVFLDAVERFIEAQ